MSYLKEDNFMEGRISGPVLMVGKLTEFEVKRQPQLRDRRLTAIQSIE
jgi:hypothetical protein